MPKDFDDLRLLIEAALNKASQTRERLEQADDEPNRGDLYTYPETARDGIEWALIMQNHDDDRLWFAVPFDQTSLVGTWDVEVCELSDSGPGTLRCGQGIWIHTDDLPRSARSGFVSDRDIHQARVRLAAMVGDAVDIPLRHNIDDDPDYLEWMDEVAKAAERLETKFQEPVRNFKLSDFREEWSQATGIVAATSLSLAADTGGLGAGPSDVIPPLNGTVLAEQLPGVLVALKRGEEVRLLYKAAGAEDLPTVGVEIEDTEQQIGWRALSDDVHESIQAIAASECVSILVNGKHCCTLSP